MRVVENLPDEMMEAGGADAADVHAGALADGLEPFEDGDVFCCVAGHLGVLRGSTGFYGFYTVLRVLRGPADRSMRFGDPGLDS